MSKSRALVLAFILLLFTLVFASCTKTEYKVSDVQAQAYVRTDGIMGLSLYVLPNASSSDKSSKKTVDSVQFSVKSPDGNLSWSLPASKVSYDRLSYYGSSDICMPQGLDLPKGLWSVDVVFSDGSTVTQEFSISYTDKSSALFRYAELGSSDPWFDEKSNLTVVP